MIADQHESLCKAEWTKTCRQGDLRSFIDYTVVKVPSSKERVVDAESGCSYYLRCEISLFQFGS